MRHLRYGVRLRDASIGRGSLVLFLHGYPSFWYQTFILVAHDWGANVTWAFAMCITRRCWRS